MLVGDERETHGTKRVDTTEGDEDRVDIRSHLVATELKVHQVKIGILRDDVFSATPPLEAGQLLRSLLTTESKQAQVTQTHVH